MRRTTTTAGRRQAARAVLRSRRGAIAVALAVSATALLGMGALATEAGIWLTVRRHLQAAADAGAYAGVSSLAIRGNITTGVNAVTAVAADAVERNGLRNGTEGVSVMVQVGYWNGSSFVAPAPVGNSPNAVRVDVTQPQRTGLARLISAAAPVAWGGAVAVIEQGGPACTLTIPPGNPPGSLSTSQVGGRTNIAGSTTVNAPNCLMVSNATGRRAINIQNASAARAATIGGLRASGECYNCAEVMGGNMPANYNSNAVPTPNPYAAVDAAGVPNFNNSDCRNPTYLDADGRPTNANRAVSVSLTPFTGGALTATCDNIAIGAGQTLTLTPGTYYFNGASLSQTGGRIACSGCGIGGAGVTLVFTGNNANGVGNIQITGGEFNLTAPGRGLGQPAIYDGIVIYRDDLARVSNSANDAIKITGNSGSTIFGAIYAPTTHVELEGTGTMNQTPTGAGGCLAVVAGEITYSGNTGININACDANGTPVPRIRYVRLAQ